MGANSLPTERKKPENFSDFFKRSFRQLGTGTGFSPTANRRRLSGGAGFVYPPGRNRENFAPSPGLEKTFT